MEAKHCLKILEGCSHYEEKVDAICAYSRQEQTFYAKKWADLVGGNEHTRDIYLWGAGNFSKDLLENFFPFLPLKIKGCCDNAREKWGTIVSHDLRCLSPQELLEVYRQSPVHIVIAVNHYSHEIISQCIKLGFRAKDLFVAPISSRSWLVNYLSSVEDGYLDQYSKDFSEVISYFEDEHSKNLMLQILYRRLISCDLELAAEPDQYFIPQFPIRKNEAFVDAGAYTGDTLRNFSKKIPVEMLKNNEITYYALECSPQNYSHLASLHKNQFPFRLETHPVALWDQNTVLNFSEIDASSVVCKQGAVQVRACKLDDLLADTPVTWIKMDIEGAELRALHGCEQLIRKNHPRLSICVYHCPSDIIEIPRYIKSLNPDYKMLLQHHGEYDCETVLYAF